MEWIETTGATLDEAKERALDRLGVAEDELEYEVLAEATRSMLGLRRTEARMRARVRPTSPRPKVERSQSPWRSFAWRWSCTAGRWSVRRKAQGRQVSRRRIR